MSKREQEAANSDLASKKSKKSLVLPLAVAGRGNPERTDEVRVSRQTDLCDQNRDARFIEKRKEAKVNSRRVQLAALSKVVNTAFTGWTIKTQR